MPLGQTESYERTRVPSGIAAGDVLPQSLQLMLVLWPTLALWMEWTSLVAVDHVSSVVLEDSTPFVGAITDHVTDKGSRTWQP